MSKVQQQMINLLWVTFLAVLITASMGTLFLLEFRSTVRSKFERLDQLLDDAYLRYKPQTNDSGSSSFTPLDIEKFGLPGDTLMSVKYSEMDYSGLYATRESIEVEAVLNSFLGVDIVLDASKCPEVSIRNIRDGDFTDGVKFAICAVAQYYEKKLDAQRLEQACVTLQGPEPLGQNFRYAIPDVTLVPNDNILKLN